MQGLDNKSRMSGDVHVRFRERLRGWFPRPIRLVARLMSVLRKTGLDQNTVIILTSGNL